MMGKHPVKIIPPPWEGGKPQDVVPTRIEIDGKEVPGVVSAVIRLVPGRHVVAELEMTDLGAPYSGNAYVESVWALPFMSEESFLDAAKRYGYEVKKGTPHEG